MGPQNTNQGRGLLVWTQTGDVVVLLDSHIKRLKRPPIVGAGLDVLVGNHDGNPTLYREEDLRLGPSTLIFELPKSITWEPWVVAGGYARNGGRDYPTTIPDGVYRTLRGTVIENSYQAIP